MAKNYFKSTYEPCSYSPNWYGTLDYAPNAIVLLYDDNQGFCIGYMESELPEGVIPMTEVEVLAKTANTVDAEGVYFGDKLGHRWDEVVTDG
jgi:hypothetical protein